MARKKKQIKKTGEVSDDSKDWCPCKVYNDKDDETLIIECEECRQWWHQKCVGLEGLTEDAIKDLTKWKCPKCIMNGLGIAMGSIQETVKAEIEQAVPMIVKSVVEATVKAKEFKRTFADVAAARSEQIEKKVEKTVEKTMHSAIKDNQQKLLDKAAQKQDADHYERVKRQRNIVIKNLRESNRSTPTDRYNSDMKKVMDILEIEEKVIVRCYRAGAKKEGNTRLLIVTLLTPDHAQHYHNYGAGYRIETNGDKKDIWINPDLIKADREANYMARRALRERREALEKKRQVKNPSAEEEKKPDSSEEAKNSTAKEAPKEENKKVNKGSEPSEDGADSDVSTGSFL